MKRKFEPVAQIDEYKNKFRVTYQHVAGGVILGKLFATYDEALLFAKSVTQKVDVNLGKVS